MANKRLSIPEIEKMKKMVQSGIAPEDIKNHFGIAVSSVHNYKKRFKADGLSFPTVKGKRPTRTLRADIAENTDDDINSGSKKSDDSYQFKINGMVISISGTAKNIKIGKYGVVIDF